VVGKNYQVAVKVVVGFSGPVVSTVSGNFIPEMVAQWEEVGKVIGQFTLVVSEKYQVPTNVAAEFSGPVHARVIGKFILEMVAMW
jgi:hypothetical protein